jgi:hypothetical protein
MVQPWLSPFSNRKNANVGAGENAHPGLSGYQSEKQELELARSLCDSGSITTIIVRLLSTRVEQKETSYGAGRDTDDASGASRRA